MLSLFTPGGIAYRIIVLSVMACVLGILVSLAAIGFIESVAWLNDRLLIAPRARVQLQNQTLLMLATVLIPMTGGLMVGYLFRKISSEKRPLGPPDSIRAVQLHTPLPHWKDGLISTVAAALSLGCGASVGQYGPMVYLGSLLGELASKLKFKVPNLQSIAIACGVAAAISTAFNAPIAGLIFAHEVILRHYSLQAFAPTTVAAATGYIVANVIFERPPLFLVEFNGILHSYEFALFAVLGISCAFLATAFMQLILAFTRLANKHFIPAMLRPAAAGLLVGLVALGLPDVLGTGNEALRFATIPGAFDQQELLLLVAAKLVLTALCVGFGFAGGVFSPALLSGILFGALFWGLLETLGLATSGIAVYAICGMMALSSPVMGAPLTTILIVFELTRNYHLTIAAMVAVVFANLIAFRLFGRSLFDVQLAIKGIDLSFGRDRAILQNTRVIDQPMSDYLTFYDDQPCGHVLEKLLAHKRSEAAVIDSADRYLGIIKIQDVIHPPATQTIAVLIQRNWLQFNETTSLWQAMRTLNDFVGEAIPVVDSNRQILLGMISESALIEAYLAAVHTLRREENAAA